MNENVDGMMIRLVGLALAVLMMAGMTIYTDLFKKTSDILMWTLWVTHGTTAK